jgi:hypothetical protein
MLAASATGTKANSGINPSTTLSTLYTGYQVQGPFNLNSIRIKGSWIVPTADCSVNPNSVSNISVVIDGISGEGDVMQVGTYQNCVNGQAVYGAFANFSPHSKREILPTLTINPGDTIEAQGKWDPTTSSWHAQIIDVTSNVKQALGSGKTPTGFSPKLDSGAFLLSNDGKTLTKLSTTCSGVTYMACSGKDYSGVTKSDIVGADKANTAFGSYTTISGFTVVGYQMSGTALSSPSSDGTSFTIS